MNIENLTQNEIDALTAPATGTIKIIVPTKAGVASFVPMAGCIVKVNGVDFVEGVDFTAATDAATTATSLSNALHAATSDILCDSAVDGSDTSLVVLTANDDGPDGNAISISVTMPAYTFPSGPHLDGGALPLAGDLVFNSDDSKLNLYSGTTWEEVTSA
jgi:hypothetical protein